MTNKNILLKESIKNENDTLKLPVSIHENSDAWIGVLSCILVKNKYKESMNDIPTVPHAMIVVSDFDNDLLAKPMIAKPSKGNKGIKYIS
jgi:hypothetical protein